MHTTHTNTHTDEYEQLHLIRITFIHGIWKKKIWRLKKEKGNGMFHRKLLGGGGGDPELLPWQRVGHGSIWWTSCSCSPPLACVSTHYVHGGMRKERGGGVRGGGALELDANRWASLH